MVARHAFRLFPSRPPLQTHAMSTLVWKSFELVRGFAYMNKETDWSALGAYPHQNLLLHFIKHLQIKHKKDLSRENHSRVLDFSSAFNAENATNYPIRITLKLSDHDLLQYFLRQTARYCSTKYSEECKDLQYFPYFLALQSHSAGINCIDLSNISYEQLDKRSVDFINRFNGVLRILLTTNPGITTIVDTNSDFRGRINYNKSLVEDNRLAAESIVLSQTIPDINKRIYDFLGIKLSNPASTQNVLVGTNRLLLEDAKSALSGEKGTTNEVMGLLGTLGKLFFRHLETELDLDPEELDLEQPQLDIMRSFRRDEQNNKQKMAKYLINYFADKEFLAITVSAEYNRDKAHRLLEGFMSTVEDPANYSLMKKALKILHQSHLELSKKHATLLSPMTEKEKEQAIERMSRRLRQQASLGAYDEKDYREYRTKTGEIHSKIQDFFDYIPTIEQSNDSTNIVALTQDETNIAPRFGR